MTEKDKKAETTKSFQIKKGSLSTGEPAKESEKSKAHLTAKSDQEAITLTKKKKKPSKVKQNIFSGRRKTSVARIRIIEGDGKVIINKKKLSAYFPVNDIQRDIMASLLLLNQEKKVNVHANVRGGGFRGQAGAISLALAKALSHDNDTNKKKLRSEGLLTRDPRMVERKKYGLHKAEKGASIFKKMIVSPEGFHLL